MPVLAKMAFLVAALRQDLIERAWHCIKSRVKASISAGIVAALLLPLSNAEAASENLVDFASALGLAATLAMTLVTVSAVFAAVAFFMFYVVSYVLGTAEMRAHIVPDPYPTAQKSWTNGVDAIDRLTAGLMRWWRTPRAFASSAHPLAGQTDFLVRRMTALGLNAETVARSIPNTFRDLERLCAACESQELCKWDLKHDPTDQAWQDYCPKAATLGGLGAFSWLRRESSPWTLF